MGKKISCNALKRETSAPRYSKNIFVWKFPYFIRSSFRYEKYCATGVNHPTNPSWPEITVWSEQWLWNVDLLAATQN